jgi:tetrahydrodipicolinate N-succinyltransferase
MPAPDKLYERVKKLVNILSENHKNLHVHNNINEFYYMQKVEELKQLEESITDAYLRLESLSSKYHAEYTQLYFNWKKDARWINKLVNLEKQEVETK